MSKNVLIAILGIGLVPIVILLVSNFNVQININSKDKESSASQQTIQTTQKVQADSMTSHHGGRIPVEGGLFNSLIDKLAPDFTLESYDGKKITLTELKGKNVILFFNEGLMCYPSCWNQIAAFGSDAKLQNKAVILNITVDSKNNWKQAIDKMPELNLATVLFDSNRQVSQKYGVLTLPSSMHKSQFPGHSYVIINKEGIIKSVRDDISMAVRNNELSKELDKI